MDNKVLIFWRIKNFPYDDPSSPQEKISKPQKNTSNRGRKPKRLSQIKIDSSVNYGASTSDSTEDFTPDKKRPPKLSVKVLTQMERRKTRKSSLKKKCNTPSILFANNKRTFNKLRRR
ncbi:hypothetical protein CEXT_673131 [Caerostris extrusa]|uniref:Uncharacterized protein n=1 Tax=Caerostris extrusa TaxID=172846 RepID=A0AAV4UJW4_CAEEX|nr:hypothetical protein CEXT_673131 [Caerostris extrusa]